MVAILKIDRQNLMSVKTHLIEIDEKCGDYLQEQYSSNRDAVVDPYYGQNNDKLGEFTKEYQDVLIKIILKNELDYDYYSIIIIDILNIIAANVNSKTGVLKEGLYHGYTVFNNYDNLYLITEPTGKILIEFEIKELDNPFIVDSNNNSCYVASILNITSKKRPFKTQVLEIPENIIKGISYAFFYSGKKLFNLFDENKKIWFSKVLTSKIFLFLLISLVLIILFNNRVNIINFFQKTCLTSLPTTISLNNLKITLFSSLACIDGAKLLAIPFFVVGLYLLSKYFNRFIRFVNFVTTHLIKKNIVTKLSIKTTIA